jgi:hypothetical protein
MALPKYDAAASLYPSNRSYRGARHGSTFSVGATVVAQQIRVLGAGAGAVGHVRNARVANAAVCVTPERGVHRVHAQRPPLSATPIGTLEFLPDLVGDAD